MPNLPFELNNPSGDLIRANLHLPEGTSGPHPLTVICHGFKSFKDWGFHPFLAESIAAAGIAALRFDFSHNGVGEDLETFGELDKFRRNTFAKEIEDLNTVLGKVSDGTVPESGCLDKNRIATLGHSRGNAASVLVGTKDTRVKTLVAWAGISTVDRFDELTVQEWRNNGVHYIPNLRTGQQMPMDLCVLEDVEANREAYDMLATVQTLEKPYLVVHGDEDETVPFEEGSFLHDHTPRGIRKLQIVPGAGHTFGAKHPFEGSNENLDEAIRVTIEWLKARL